MASQMKRAPSNGVLGEKGRIQSKNVVAKPTATIQMLEAMLEQEGTKAPKPRKSTKSATRNRRNTTAPGTGEDNDTMWSHVVKEGGRTSNVGSLGDLVVKKKSLVLGKTRRGGKSVDHKSRPVEADENTRMVPEKPKKTIAFSNKKSFSEQQKLTSNRFLSKAQPKHVTGLKPLALRIRDAGMVTKRQRLDANISTSLSSSISTMRQPKTMATKQSGRYQHAVQKTVLPAGSTTEYECTSTSIQLPREEATQSAANLELSNPSREQVNVTENEKSSSTLDHLSSNSFRAAKSTQNSAETAGRQTNLVVQQLLDRPDIVLQDSTAMSRLGIDKASIETDKKATNNDNFVRLNLRNSSGACRGARNKKRKRYSSREGEAMDDKLSSKRRDGGQVKSSSRNQKKAPRSICGVDPLDDFVDGVFHASEKSEAPKSGTKTPHCARHHRPCKLLTVKKNTTGNKGRKFYACSMPRGEQCDHFEWAEDTKEAAKIALLKNSSYSGFIARQVATYAERFRTLTVTELKEEAKRRNLVATGKKQQLLARLSIWVRDQMAPTEVQQTDKKPDNSKTREQTVKDGETENSTDVDSITESHKLPTTLLSESAQMEDSSDEDDMEDEEESCSSLEELEIFDQPKAREVTNVGKEHDLTKTSLHDSMQALFGHSDFRDGQEWAIRRCMEQKRTLLVAPTGFGKSLCYAVPAALMHGVCIVVSPLVSLIQDQLQQLSPKIPAATLSGALSTSVMAARIDDLLRSRLKIIFVSPERLASPSFLRLFRPQWNPQNNTKQRLFPTVSLFCIDEAHCMSQWGHNFRPSYLRLKSLIDNIQPRSVLAMTATAGPAVVQDICRALSIRDCHSHLNEIQSEGVRIMDCERDNINVACLVMDSEEQRRSVLSSLLIPPKKQSSMKRPTDDKVKESRIRPGCLSEGSVIVYVWRKRDAEVVAEHLVASGVDGGVVVYHGGLDASARSKAQTKFMRGRSRICVATVAFGLGINKPDVAAVVHLHLPSSPENYLQEIGRAGRDGRSAQAIALLMEEDVVIRHSLAHSDSISKSQVRVVLSTLRELVADAIGEMHGTDSSKTIEIANPISVALPIDSVVVGGDCKYETIETILSLLEDSSMEEPLLRIEGTILDVATITLKRGSLENLAMNEPVVKCVAKCSSRVDVPKNEILISNLAREERCQDESARDETRLHSYSFGVYTFSITRCARLLGPSAEPRHVYAALRRLQNAGELELVLHANAVHVRIESCGIRMFGRAPGDTNLEALASKLSLQLNNNVLCVASKVQGIHYILNRVAAATPKPNDTSTNKSKSTNLVLFQELVVKYFNQAKVPSLSKPALAWDDAKAPKPFNNELRSEASLDVSSVLRDLSQSMTLGGVTTPVKLQDPCCDDYSALAITKFFHAIETPRTPYSSYSPHLLFGKWRDIRFSSLLETVTEILDSFS